MTELNILKSKDRNVVFSDLRVGDFFYLSDQLNSKYNDLYVIVENTIKKESWYISAFAVNLTTMEIVDLDVNIKVTPIEEVTITTSS